MNYTEDKNTYTEPKIVLAKVLCKQAVMAWSTGKYEESEGSDWDS